MRAHAPVPKPLCSDPDAYTQLKHGYARGFEAMQLVDNVRNYYDILVRMEPRQGPLEGPLDETPTQLSTKGTAAGK